MPLRRADYFKYRSRVAVFKGCLFPSRADALHDAWSRLVGHQPACTPSFPPATGGEEHADQHQGNAYVAASSQDFAVEHGGQR